MAESPNEANIPQSSSPPPNVPGTEDSGRSGQADFFERIVRYLNNALSDAELRVFEAELATDADKRDLFVHACLTHAAVSEELSTQYQILRESLTSHQQRTLETEPAPSVSESPPIVYRPAARYRWTAAAAAVAIVAISAAIVALSYRRFSPRLLPVATVTDSYRAQWLKGPDATGGLPTREDLSLASGWAEITFHTGTKVTLVGPISFKMESPTLLDLTSGRLSATVAGKDFVVMTPTARIADLGTEFGVSVADRTELAVFSGRVDASAIHGKGDLAHRILTLGEAAAVDAGQVTDDAQQAWPQLFPRRLPRNVASLSVSDLLSGGDGTMARHGTALDPAKGKWTYAGDALTPSSSVGDHAYHKVPQLPAVAGCFIPDGRTTVDPAENAFDFGPTTNLSYNQLRVGGIIPWLRDDPHRMRTVLSGTDYSQSPHNLVEFQSNKGITLDLEELRAIHPGAVFGEFLAILGNSFPRHLGGEAFVAKTGVYILVDGQPRLQNPQFSNQDNPLAVHVPLHPTDHFLTIAITDGGDGVNGDWVLLGDPEITLTDTGAAP